jgi:hypothetical protein
MTYDFQWESHKAESRIALSKAVKFYEPKDAFAFGGLAVGGYVQSDVRFY